MSYDVWLTIDTGGTEPARVGGSHDMTSNVAPMWRLAGCDLALAYLRKAGEVLPELVAAIEAMGAEPDRYRALEPENGWGSYEDCLRFLQALRDEFAAHPEATVNVWH